VAPLLLHQQEQPQSVSFLLYDCRTSTIESQLRISAYQIMATSRQVQQYAYQPLHQHDIQIRLLRLKCPSDQLITVSCEVQTFDLSRAPPYLALSYVWGHPHPQIEILLDNESFAVTETLWDFLHFFQYNEDNHDGKTYIWIVRPLSFALWTEADFNRIKSALTNRIRQSEATLSNICQEYTSELYALSHGWGPMRSPNVQRPTLSPRILKTWLLLFDY
jgi:hypothetical protein